MLVIYEDSSSSISGGSMRIGQLRMRDRKWGHRKWRHRIGSDGTENDISHVTGVTSSPEMTSHEVTSFSSIFSYYSSSTKCSTIVHVPWLPDMTKGHVTPKGFPWKGVRMHDRKRGLFIGSWLLEVTLSCTHILLIFHSLIVRFVFVCVVFSVNF